MEYVVLSSSDEIVKVGHASDLNHIEMQADEHAGETAFLLPDGALGFGTIHVEPLQNARWSEVKFLRDAWLDQGITIDGLGSFDSDAKSRDVIHKYATAALFAKQAGESFTVDWTMADNSSRTLDSDQILSLHMTVMAHVQQGHTYARQLRDSIFSNDNSIALLRMGIDFSPV